MIISYSDSLREQEHDSIYAEIAQTWDAKGNLEGSGLVRADYAD